MYIKHINYFSLRRKSDDIEVYSSPAYFRDDSTEIINFEHVYERLNFYFERVNSGIKQQLESPKLSNEQKASLKLLNTDDYYIAMMEMWNDGGYFKKTLWKEDYRK